MDTLSVVPDREYEEARQAAERAYYLADTDWLRQLSDEAQRLPKVKRSIGTLRAAAAAALRGDELPPTPKRAVSSELIQKQIELCRNFAQMELTAYLELLKRQGSTPSQLVVGIEAHTIELVAEVKRRKWSIAIGKLDGLFDPCIWIEDSWTFLVDRIQDLLHEQLIPRIWFLGATERGVASSVSATRAEQPKDHGQYVRRFQSWRETAGRDGGKLTMKVAAGMIPLNQRDLYAVLHGKPNSPGHRARLYRFIDETCTPSH